MMLNPGDHFGRYVVERILGSGGMGVVYLARDERLGRQVAMKLVHGQIARDVKFSDRFQREGQTLALLSHPHIVGMYDMVEEDGQAALVMEYIAGEGLDSVIARMGLIPPGRCLPLFRQIGDAIAYAHSRGVVHRDLKPANVMVTTDGTAKVMDFGIARLVSRETRITRLGSSVGTLGYMSPEVLKGRDATEVSDVYSLGAMLYEMLTGRLPYAAGSTDEMLEEIRQTPIPSPRTIYPYIPEVLEAAVLRALAIEPGLRWPSVTQLLDALAGVQLAGDSRALDVRVSKPTTPPPMADARPSLELFPLPFKSKAGWEARTLAELAARSDLNPQAVFDEYASGELAVWMKAIGREDWIEKLQEFRQYTDARLALATFLDPQMEEKLRKEIAEREEQHARQEAASLRARALAAGVKVSFSGVPSTEELGEAQEAVEAVEKRKRISEEAEHLMELAQKWGLDLSQAVLTSEEDLDELRLRIRAQERKSTLRRTSIRILIALVVSLSVIVLGFRNCSGFAIHNMFVTTPKRVRVSSSEFRELASSQRVRDVTQRGGKTLFEAAFDSAGTRVWQKCEAPNR